MSSDELKHYRGMPQYDVALTTHCAELIERNAGYIATIGMQKDLIHRLEAHNAELVAALDEILAECDEAPTDNNAWVVAIQRIARAANPTPR